MQLSKGRAVATLAAAAFAGSATTAVSATGHERGDRGHHRSGALLKASVAPEVPSDPVLNGANPGGAPWVIKRGEARLARDGDFRVSLRGLVIPNPPGDGTPGPVTTVSASLYCGDSTMATGTTPSVPISRAGNAEITGHITVPAKCLAPTVLIHPNGATGAYIAASGFGA
jgi:hypothetical protein